MQYFFKNKLDFPGRISEYIDMTLININLFNMLFTKRSSFIADPARTLPAIPLLISVRTLADRSGLFSFNLLLKWRVALPSHAEHPFMRRVTFFLKGTSNVRCTDIKSSVGSVMDFDGLPDHSADLVLPKNREEIVAASLPESLHLKGIITDKLPLWTNIVKIKI